MKITIKISNQNLKKRKLKTKREPTDWENIFANDATDKGLTSKISKQLIQHSNKKKQSNLIKKKGGRDVLKSHLLSSNWKRVFLKNNVFKVIFDTLSNE